MKIKAVGGGASYASVLLLIASCSPFLLTAFPLVESRDCVGVFPTCSGAYSPAHVSFGGSDA